MSSGWREFLLRVADIQDFLHETLMEPTWRFCKRQEYMSSFLVMSFLLKARLTYRSPRLLWRRALYRRTPRSSHSIPEIAALGALSGVAGVQRSTVLLQIMGRCLRWPHPSHRLVHTCKSQRVRRVIEVEQSLHIWSGRSVPQSPDPYVLKISQRPALTS